MREWERPHIMWPPQKIGWLLYSVPLFTTTSKSKAFAFMRKYGWCQWVFYQTCMEFLDTVPKGHHVGTSTEWCARKFWSRLSFVHHNYRDGTWPDVDHVKYRVSHPKTSYIHDINMHFICLVKHTAASNISWIFDIFCRSNWSISSVFHICLVPSIVELFHLRHKTNVKNRWNGPNFAKALEYLIFCVAH